MNLSEEPERTGSATTEGFELLLARLAPEPEAAGYEYERLRARLANYFRLKGLATPLTVADLTLDRVATLMVAKQIEDLDAFCFGVARFVCLEQYRAEQRQREANEAFVKEANQKQDDPDEFEFDVLRNCLKRLPTEEQELLKNYFADLAPSERRARRTELANNAGISLNGLRLRVHRSRQALEKCLHETRKQ
jgi:DNA-directed RNA polymerase specialized sigma24 family protein